MSPANAIDHVFLETLGSLHSWIPRQLHSSQAYLLWLQQQPARLPHLPEPMEPVEITTDRATPHLPESGTGMSRFKVGHGFAFSIFRSITGGVWLDGGEWEALRQRNFHDEIHLVFTAPWQKQVRTTQMLATYEETLKSSLAAKFPSGSSPAD